MPVALPALICGFNWMFQGFQAVTSSLPGSPMNNPLIFRFLFCPGCDPNIDCLVSDTERVELTYSSGDVFIVVDGGEGYFDLNVSCCSGAGGDIFVPADYATIQPAIDAVCEGYTVWIADGIYTGTENKNLDAHGKRITIRSVSDDPTQCAIDCENDGSGFIFATSEDSWTILRGIAIRNGHTGFGGGGVQCEYSSPTITNCRFETCEADLGGGIGLVGSSSEITDCVFSGNSADYGAGLGCSGGAPLISDCTFINNTADSDGGGMACITSSPVVTDCVFETNNARCGAGIESAFGAYPVITLCTFNSNSANDDGGAMEFHTSCIPRYQQLYVHEQYLR